MGMFRDPGEQEIDLVKEMAESLGSAGLKLDELLERVGQARERVLAALAQCRGGVDLSHTFSVEAVNESIREYNSLVDKSEDALQWLLIQREACGFRIHRDVDHYYPIPPKMKLLKP
jgi:hypothetical protein